MPRWYVALISADYPRETVLEIEDRWRHRSLRTYGWSAQDAVIEGLRRAIGEWTDAINPTIWREVDQYWEHSVEAMAANKSAVTGYGWQSEDALMQVLLLVLTEWVQ